MVEGKKEIRNCPLVAECFATREAIVMAALKYLQRIIIKNDSQVIDG